MIFTIVVNQAKCIKYGLNVNQGALMELFCQLPTWATVREISGKTYWHISRNKVIEEIPLFYSKPDTVYRSFMFLRKEGLIDYIQQNRQDFVRLTAKGAQWNKVGNKSELGNESDQLGNESEFNKSVNSNENQGVKVINSEMNPTYNIINNTNDKSEEKALAFLEQNYPSAYTDFMAKYKTKIGADFQAFADDYNCKVIEEGIEWTRAKLFARLERLANNWIRNNFNTQKQQYTPADGTPQGPKRQVFNPKAM